MVNVSASSFSQMALRHFLEELGWNIVLGTFVLLRFQQLDLNAVERIQKTQEMRKKYLPIKSTFTLLYCHYILNPSPSGLILVCTSPVQEKTLALTTLSFCAPEPLVLAASHFCKHPSLNSSLFSLQWKVSHLVLFSLRRDECSSLP